MPVIVYKGRFLKKIFKLKIKACQSFVVRLGTDSKLLTLEALTQF